MNWTLWVVVGCVYGALGVMAGAFGGHALKSRLDPQALQVFETAVRYQMYHALALFGVALVASHVHSLCVRLAGFSFSLGILLFSGSLYALVLLENRSLGVITPIGGALFILGWLLLAAALVF